MVKSPAATEAMKAASMAGPSTAAIIHPVSGITGAGRINCAGRVTSEQGRARGVPAVIVVSNREPFARFGTVGELSGNNVQQFLRGDVAARCFGVELGSKHFNTDRH